MAYITAVKFYIENTHYDPTTYSVRGGVLSGNTFVASQIIAGTSIPNGSPGWVTFTLSSSVEITEDDFVSIGVQSVCAYPIGERFRLYEASDWNEKSSSPYDGQEDAKTYNSPIWFDYGPPGFAYDVSVTGMDSNGATSPDSGYRSMGGSKLSRVDTYLMGASVPSKPTNPTPANADTGVDFSSLTLSWDDGGGANTFDVYIGPNGSLVKVSDAQAGTSKVVDFGDVPLEQIIYWRVDATNESGTTTGDTWHFDARPAKVTNPVPIDAASNISLYPEYSWDESAVADTYTLNVGIGELSGDISIIVPDLTDPSYDSRVVDFQNGYIWGYGSTYYWRVDAINDFGTTEGDEWYFNSIELDPPLPSGITLDEDGEPTGTPNGENNIVTVRRLIAAANSRIWFEDV